MKSILSCIVICSLLLFMGCAGEEPVNVLSVTTNTPTNVTATNVTLGGNVTNADGITVTSKGVCVGLTPDPTIDDANDARLEMGSGAGAFSDNYTGFDPGTTYHVRAYATSASGTVYGENLSFTTLAGEGLSVTTNVPSGVTSTNATLGGNVTNGGSSTVTSKGVCIGLTSNPTIDDSEDLTLEIGSGVGPFSEAFTGFEPGTTYHVRAYATNASGTVYGQNESFTTDDGGCPVVAVNPSNAAVSISSPTTWLSGKVYVVTGDVTVTSTLTIQAGAIIKINGARFTVNGSGKILANGTAASRITFTSLFDDSYCGDTNGDGSATTPNKGDWTSVYLNGGTGNTFKYCDFLYAGKSDGGYNNCVLISTAGTSFEFDNCTFAHTLSSANSTAFAFHGGSYMIDNSVSKFTNNAFYDNDRPLYINTYYNLSATNIFHNPANVNEKNKRNGIWLYNTTNQGATLTFSVTEVPFVISAFFNGGGSGASDVVNINANVILKFENSTAGISKSASRTVNLNASAILTSIKDDARGGDTNGDGSATSPANNDWDGFYNYANSSYVSGANIHYDSH